MNWEFSVENENDEIFSDESQFVLLTIRLNIRLVHHFSYKKQNKQILTDLYPRRNSIRKTNYISSYIHFTSIQPLFPFKTITAQFLFFAVLLVIDSIFISYLFCSPTPRPHDPKLTYVYPSNNHNNKHKKKKHKNQKYRETVEQLLCFLDQNILIRSQKSISSWVRRFC